MLNIVIIVIMLIFSAFFSASETAFSTVNRIRLKNYAAQGNKHAERTLKIASKYDKTLTAILVGNNIVNIASASLCTVVFVDLLGEGSVGIATAVMTVAVLIFGEILPKTIAKENAEAIALAFSGFLGFIIWLLTPVVWMFGLIQKLVYKFFSKNGREPSVTEDELKYIIDEIEDEGVLEEREGELVRSALDFDEIEIGQILVPRVNVIAVEVNQSVESIKEIFLSERFSRMPVYEKSIDNIIGIINQKDFFQLVVTGGNSIRGIIKEALYVYDLMLISDALHQMQRDKIHMAIVMDQYGGTEGIVTMEDIIEELVGEIYDENDEVINNLVQIGENEYEVSAELSISDMLEKLELPENIIDSSSTSVGGWVMEMLEKIPSVGDAVTSGIFTVKVISMDEQKLEKIRLKVDFPEEVKEGQ